ncbi:MAG: PAS domain S-box protein, partial [Oscillospiraceae bacterium]
MLRSKLTESEKRNHTKSLNEKVSYNDKKRVKSEDVEFAFNSHIPGTNTFMIVLIILSSILLFSLFYLNFIIDNQNTQLVFNNLQDESKKNMQELSQVINSEKKVFGIMQQAIPSNKESIVRISAIMNNCLEDTSFTTLGVAGLDGQSYDSDGKTSNISGEKYFEIGKSGETRVTCLKTKDKNGYYNLVYSTPLKFKGRSVGVAYGFYDSDKFKSKLRDNSTNPETFFRIIDKEGNIIISTSMLDEVNNVKNIFEQGFEFKDAKNKDAMAKIKKDVKNDKSGLCFVKNKETEKYGFYQTANYNDWSIFTGVSKNFYETISSSILFKANIIIAIILISIIVLVGGMISHNRNRKRMMTASRKHFNYVVDGINGGVIITAMDEGFPILHASRGAEKLFGYSTNEMIGLTNRQLTYRDDAQKVYSAIEKVIREESDTVDVVYRRVKKDGSLVWVNERGKTIENEKGQRILQSVFTNVDMEKRNEINLFLKAQEYDVIVEKSELVVFSYDIMRNTITIEKKIDNCEDFPIREEF